MKSFIQRNVILLLLAVVFAVLAIGYGVTVSNNGREIAAAQSQLTELTVKKEAQNLDVRTEQQGVLDDVLGTDNQRLVADHKIITDLLTTMATWESGAEYTEAWEKVERKYKLPADGQFLSTFFPAPVFNTSSSGETFYLIDAQKLNSSLGSLDIKPLGVKGTAYSYMVMADIRSSSKDGKASAGNTSVIMLTLDGKGVMSDVKGFASTAKVRVSQ